MMRAETLLLDVSIGGFRCNLHNIGISWLCCIWASLGRFECLAFFPVLITCFNIELLIGRDYVKFTG